MTQHPQESLSDELPSIIRWGLYNDFKHAVINQHNVQFELWCHDVVSKSIRDDPDFFRKLLRHGLIYPSCFNSTGLSLVYVALNENQIDIVCELVSKLTPEQILEPASIVAAHRQETIFELAVTNERIFSICWTRLEELSDQMLWGKLHQHHFTYICRFATSNLVDRMLSRGLDLASVLQVDPLHAWTEIALYHSRPKALYEWFSCQGYCLPLTENALDTPLLAAARNDRVEATSWLLFHSTDMRELWRCAIDAARRQTAGSILILQMAMKRISFQVPVPLSNWIESLAIEIVQGACNEAQEERVNLVEWYAIRKVGCAVQFADDSLLFSQSMLSMAKDANLPILVEYQQTLNDQARKMLALDFGLS
ncbi:hypothetical protein ASPZODRAFT_170424 [Penicilliopsis zonata CBS 506.65]|uniref:Uncharacterized protein n=1 Tax=Penicilliopsis zonata CBS 506.65 TaxID=1073090 RepID=A0A1L9S4F5_9EURO|nr:hypothetical protein ASPZODRAFT_170424 [Penicilliopsis zonata CBS 506.65]OJJ42048.1 hypothetical protein ASPZODRAFT_170424 [Penicilliopsis zonata CBS 506.65]